MPNKGGKVYGFSDAWAKAERMSQEMHAKEGRYEGYKGRRMKKIESPYGNHMHVREDAALGLDGCDFHYGGNHLSVLKEEALPGGDIRSYMYDSDAKVVRRFMGYKVGEGRHRIVDEGIDRSFGAGH